MFGYLCRFATEVHDGGMKRSTSPGLWLGIAFAVVIACGGSNNGGPGNGSAICGVNGTDACRTGRICNTDLGCVECNVDPDCPATDPRCIEGRCEACASNADCGAAMPACWGDHRCHAACTSAASCQQQQNLPICDLGTGACIGCKSNQDCTGTQHPLCDTVTEQCVDCLANTDCGAASPRCFLGDHTCVDCLSNADCGTAQPICDPQDFACRTGCTDNAGCSGTTPLCNTTDSQCVACLQNSDCPTADPVCNTDRGRCAICLVNTDCKDLTKPICDTQQDQAVCVQCVHNSDCPTTAPKCNNSVCQP